MKKTLLGFTIVLLLMISEILILNNDIASLKASNKILQEDLKDKKNISTLKEEKEDLNTSVSNLLAVSTFSDEDIEEKLEDKFGEEFVDTDESKKEDKVTDEKKDENK